MLNEVFFDIYAVPRMTEFRLKNLLQRFRTPEAIFAARREELLEVTGVDERLADDILSFRRDDEQKQRIRKAKEMGVRTISYLDKEFPANLKDVPHMPPVLFVRGELSDADQQAVAIVGTRNATHYGAQVAERLARELAQCGVTVVSGLARGIDTWAHRGALAGGGRTIAVLGCGVDVFYPPENRRLYDEIASHGALVTEFPMGVEPLAMNFPKRNRIVSGLARAVVAVEAGEKSGVLNTCAWAVDQGREVFAVPGRITDQRSLGTNRLIRDGAGIVTSARDILEALGLKPSEKTKPTVEIAADEKPVLEFLSTEPRHIDEVCEGLGMPMPALLSLLLQMELKGLVRQLPGKFFVRQD
ncbi:MAG: DNA-processing protein DprA [candidate division WOR-3 bacterium]